MVPNGKQMALATCALLVACGTRTWMGFGPVASPDGQFEVRVRCGGAIGHAYVEESEKECGIMVGRRGATEWLFKRRYDLTGSNVIAESRWQSESSLDVIFYEFGPGASAYSLKDKQVPRKTIRQIHFHVEPAAGGVVEQPAA